MMEELISRYEKGEVQECFCSGTAVIVCPVRLIEYKGKEYPIHINEKYQAGDLTYTIFSDLLAMQEGRIPDIKGWSRLVKQ